MPEDSRRDQQKGNKNEAKEQRKPRRRQQGPSTEKKPQIKEVPTDKKLHIKDRKAPEKPVYEPPPPEFYKNLKRETDEILKITEEENSRYKKKEIQSNWAKYEIPIETYDDIEEQENMGADYEELIQAPLSIGGHFQFKHEKSWDISSGPSMYDKYFDIDMGNLAIALSTIPFFERNNLDKSIFSETDLSTMNNRSIRFKQKYYNDKSYTTPKLEAQDKIVNLLKNTGNEPKKSDIMNDDSTNINFETKVESEDCIEENKSALNMEGKEEIDKEIEIIQGPKKIASVDITTVESKNKIEIYDKNQDSNNEHNKTLHPQKNISDDNFDDILDNTENHNNAQSKNENTLQLQTVTLQNNLMKVGDTPVDELKQSPVKALKDTTAKESKNPVIESPEDLEKWLDDFLDG